MSKLPPVHARLELIAKTQTQTKIIDSGAVCDIFVELPYTPAVRANYEIGDGPNRLFLHEVTVTPDLRRHGIATRLISALAYSAKTHGFDTIHSSVDSPHSVKIFRSLFREEDMSFFDVDPVTFDHLMPPLNSEQVIARLEQNPKNYSDFEIYLGNTALCDLEIPNIQVTLS